MIYDVIIYNKKNPRSPSGEVFMINNR
jgi:hypothetical protein